MHILWKYVDLLQMCHLFEMCITSTCRLLHSILSWSNDRTKMSWFDSRWSIVHALVMLPPPESVINQPFCSHVYNFSLASNILFVWKLLFHGMPNHKVIVVYHGVRISCFFGQLSINYIQIPWPVSTINNLGSWYILLV